MTKRFIEESFPVKEVSILSAREKSIRHGHISTLHIWWTRKPLAASRTTAYASLIAAPHTREEQQETRQFMIDFAGWQSSFNSGLIEKARKDVFASNNGVTPRVLDPFAGGGSIPLETLRLGCETYASDLNPVAVLLEKATLEFPQKYRAQELFISEKSRGNILSEDVKKWAAWIFEQAQEELSEFYPLDKDGCTPIGYIWARTIPCQNPSCGAEIPLMHQFWLAKTPKRHVSLFPYVENKAVHFKIVGDGYDTFPHNFKAGNGTVSQAIATCLVCGSVVDPDTTRRLFQEGEAAQRMLAVVLHSAKSRGKRYRLSTQEDLDIFTRAASRLNKKRHELNEDWGFDFVPTEPIRTPSNAEYKPGGLYFNFTPVVLYGMTKWGDIFNSRQKLSLIVFAELVCKAHQAMLQEEYQEDYARAICTYLALGMNRLAAYNTTLGPWHNTRETATPIFARQAVSMIWNYVETSPLATSFAWRTQIDWIVRCIDTVSEVDSNAAYVTQSSATNLKYPADYFDAVFTDPPYYDNLPYSYLSDFFYCWLKRTLGPLYPDLFVTPLTPTREEALAELPLLRGMKKTLVADEFKNVKNKEKFEELLGQSFQEIYRVLKPNGIAVIVYAHKSTEGWETLINSLLDSGLVVTASWPLNTEMAARIRAKDSATLASSIYIIARKMARQQTAFYAEVKEELKNHLNSKLQTLWEDQTEPLDSNVKTLLGKELAEMDLFSGADFFIAAIGSAIEIFGRYEQVIDYDGSIIRAGKLLDDVRTIVTDFAVKQILHNGFGGEISDLTRFYVLWRWNYGEARAPFDNARKLAQSCGIDVVQEWNKSGFIKKEKEFVRALGPQMRNVESLENSRELIDVLHHVCLLWGAGEREEMLTVLSESGLGNNEAFYRVAQAISETLPNDSKEKQLLEGFLAGKASIKHDIKEAGGPTTLSDWA